MQENRIRLAEPLAVGGVALPGRVFLAPMSGVTDTPFRRRAAAHGAGMVVSEMIASGELMKNRIESARRLERIDGIAHVVQLAGHDPVAMAEAARIATGEGADIIDINMGCPAKKVTGASCGSALMREPDQALRLVEAVVSATQRPVSVKMRLGWDATSINAPAIAARCVAAGVTMITVHGRTRSQFYAGAADWDAIRAVRDAVSVPLVANGDIQSADDAVRALANSGADAVMVGRAHYGRPWLAGEISGRGAGPRASEMAAYVLSHYEDMLLHYGRERGLRHSRKHLGWYLDRYAPQADEALRAALMTSTDVRVVAGLISAVFEEVEFPKEDAA